MPIIGAERDELLAEVHLRILGPEGEKSLQQFHPLFMRTRRLSVERRTMIESDETQQIEDETAVRLDVQGTMDGIETVGDISR